MTTRFVGVKEFRQNMALIAKEARTKDQRLIIIKKNEPIFELRPLSKKDMILENLLRGIQEAEADAKAGRLYTQKHVEKLLGL